jgi:mycothiol synthase
VDIRLLDPASIDHPDAVAWHDVDVVLSLEHDPDDEPRPLEQLVLEAQTPSPEATITRWLAWDGDQAVGYGEVEVRDTPDNRHLAYGWIGVRPEARRRGIGRGLARRVAEVADAAGRTKVHTHCPQGSGGQPFCESIGGVYVYLARRSRCLVADIDMDLMQAWVDEERPGYSLVQWEAPTPDELLAPYAEILHVMNTAPLQDMDLEDEVFTPELVRGWEEQILRRRGSKIVSVCRHDATGAFVGLSELVLDGFREGDVAQWNTGVDPGHRGHGIGRQLKGANALRLRELRPGAVFIDTFNQDENTPMLAINTAMGFKPHRRYTEYQIPVEEILKRA